MIADLKHGSTVPTQHRDMNLRTRRRILDGVIYKIHQHLNDQPCIHPYQQRFIAAIRRNRMFRTSAVDMPKRFRNDVLRDLIGQMQFDAPVSHFGNGKKIFHKLRQPLRVVINIRKNPHPRRTVQSFEAVYQRIRVAGN